MLYDENRRVMRALEVGAETIKHAPAQPLRRLREAELQVVVLPADCAGRQARRDHVEHSWRGATGGDGGGGEGKGEYLSGWLSLDFLWYAFLIVASSAFLGSGSPGAPRMVRA